MCQAGFHPLPSPSGCRTDTRRRRGSRIRRASSRAHILSGRLRRRLFRPRCRLALPTTSHDPPARRRSFRLLRRLSRYRSWFFELAQLGWPQRRACPCRCNGMSDPRIGTPCRWQTLKNPYIDLDANCGHRKALANPSHQPCRSLRCHPGRNRAKRDESREPFRELEGHGMATVFQA